MSLRLAHTIERSLANGPGERFVIWVQGCPIHCPGCWNKGTWNYQDGYNQDLVELTEKILNTKGIEGVTFTGGEPMVQASALLRVAEICKINSLSVFIFTGYDFDQLKQPEQLALWNAADIVVAGPYIESKRSFSNAWVGSENQIVHFNSDRYTPTDQLNAVRAEAHISKDGSVTWTGFPEGLTDLS